MINYYVTLDDCNKVTNWYLDTRDATKHVKQSGGSIQYVEGLIMDGTPYVMKTVGDRIHYDTQGRRKWAMT